MATATFAALVFAAACGDKPAHSASSAPPAPAAPVAAAPCATCQTIEVRMITDDKGNYFVPATIEAHEGDMLRFTLVTGVHNVHFLSDSNPGARGLPGMSDMLQLPGQTFDVALNFGAGNFFFQCDPHALLGMVGRVEVEKRER